MVMYKIKGKETPQVTCTIMLKSIVETLFPQRPNIVIKDIGVERSLYVSLKKSSKRSAELILADYDTDTVLITSRKRLEYPNL